MVKSIPRNNRNIKIRDSFYWIDIDDDPIYMMMPVWFFTFMYKGKPYTILVNGQTGKVVGTMPWNNSRVWAIAIAIFVLITAFISYFFIAAPNGWIDDVGQVYIYAMATLIAFTMVVFTKGLTGLRRIFKNLRLTQSEGIFNYVKKRQV